jgi:hypothetical protein
MTTDREKNKNAPRNIILTFGGICIALMAILTFTGKAQDIVAKAVIDSRKEYFREDHKPLCDTMDSLKRIMCLKDSMNSKMVDRIDKITCLLNAMATSDQKTQAKNDYNEAKETGLLR